MTTYAFIDANDGYYQCDVATGAAFPDWTKGLTPTTVRAVAAIAPAPDINGFIAAIKTAMGGILAANSLMVTYPAFMPAVQQAVWADVQTLIIDANTKALITPTQYAAFKTAVATYHIPLTLP